MCVIDKVRLNYLTIHILFIFCIAQKTIRSEKSKYSVLWFGGASRSWGQLVV